MSFQSGNRGLLVVNCKDHPHTGVSTSDNLQDEFYELKLRFCLCSVQ